MSRALGAPAVLLAVVLTACGGGDVAPPDTAALAESTPTSVLFLGDSTFTAFWGGVSVPGEVQRQRPGWAVEALAVSGTGVCDALSASGVGALGHLPAGAVVVANYGLNDAYGSHEVRGAPRTPLAAFASCAEALSRAVRAAGGVMVWMEANPVLASPGFDPAAALAYETVKRGLGDFWCRQPATLWGAGTLPDGMHPADWVVPEIARHVIECVTRAR